MLTSVFFWGGGGKSSIARARNVQVAKRGPVRSLLVNLLCTCSINVTSRKDQETTLGYTYSKRGRTP